jgi:hypothetical protein
MTTMPRSRLVDEPQARRENEVRILVPLPGGGSVRLEVRGVAYNSLADDIEIRTEPWWWKGDDADGEPS